MWKDKFKNDPVFRPESGYFRPSFAFSIGETAVNVIKRLTSKNSIRGFPQNFNNFLGRFDRPNFSAAEASGGSGLRGDFSRRQN